MSADLPVDDERGGRYRVACYRMSRAVPELTSHWPTFADAQDEAKRRVSPGPSMRTKANRRTPDATGTTIYNLEDPTDEPYRLDADPPWFDAVVAADGAFPYGADLPARKVAALLRAGASR